MTLENTSVQPGLWEYKHEQTKASPPANSLCIRGLKIGDWGGQAAKFQTAVILQRWGGVCHTWVVRLYGKPAIANTSASLFSNKLIYCDLSCRGRNTRSTNRPICSQRNISPHIHNYSPSEYSIACPVAIQLESRLAIYTFSFLKIVDCPTF